MGRRPLTHRLRPLGCPLRLNRDRDGPGSYQRSTSRAPRGGKGRALLRGCRLRRWRACPRSGEAGDQSVLDDEVNGEGRTVRLARGAYPPGQMTGDHVMDIVCDDGVRLGPPRIGNHPGGQCSGRGRKRTACGLWSCTATSMLSGCAVSSRVEVPPTDIACPGLRPVSRR